MGGLILPYKKNTFPSGNIQNSGWSDYILRRGNGQSGCL
jgi:hypothetical protein